VIVKLQLALSAILICSLAMSACYAAPDLHLPQTARIFTVEYSITAFPDNPDVEAAFKKETLEKLRYDLRKEVHAGQLTQASADQLIRDVATEKPAPLEHWDILISSDGKATLYVEKRDNTVQRAVLLNGEKTYQYSWVGLELHVDPGTSARGIFHWPCLPFGSVNIPSLMPSPDVHGPISGLAFEPVLLPFVPGSGRVRMNVAPKVHGKLFFDGVGSNRNLTRLEVSPNSGGVSADFSGWRNVDGISIPENIKQTSWWVSRSHPGARAKQWRVQQFKLIRYSPHAEGSGSLLIDSYLPDTNRLMVQQGKMAFTYAPNRGSVDEQIQRHLAIQSNSKPQTIRVAEPLPVGSQAPDFEAVDADGGIIRLSSLRGEIVVLDFWATWCEPCIASMIHVQKVNDLMKEKKVYILLLNVWDVRMAFDKWIKTNGQYRLHFAYDPAGRRQPGIPAVYKVHDIPTTYVIGANGNVAAMIEGFQGPTDHRLEAALDKQLASGPPNRR